jgi:tyrosyl-tRNA synthetase
LAGSLTDVKKDINYHLKTIRENAVDVISEEEIRAKLKDCSDKDRPLILKIGFDPTAPDIHLGHTVLLRKLRKLQDLGHKVFLLIGDFTARIGDPSGKTALRPVLTDKEIKANASTYTGQAFKILDKKMTTVVKNSDWYKDMEITDFLSLLSLYTLARMLERDDFSSRLRENRPLTMLEMAYPLIQGYDSCKLKADIEFGGTDQKFNLIVGRHLQEAFGQEPQAVVTMPILVGLDGKNKMSKSLGNYIGITESPQSMFGKVMSISDEVMWEYFRLLTDEDISKVKAMHPKEAKLSLAEIIVTDYHGDAAAGKAREEFERVFSKGEVPADMPVCPTGSNDLIIVEEAPKHKLVKSKNEVRRLMNQGAIYTVNPEDGALTPLKDEKIPLGPQGVIVKIGKKIFAKFVR